jgi:PAS domain S-box-containing protein
MHDLARINHELTQENELLKCRIHELEKVEKELLNINNQWAEIFDAINDSVCLIAPSGKMILHNKATELLLGKSANELDGHYCYEVVHGISKHIPDCPFLQMKNTMRRACTHLKYGDRWLEVTTDPIMNNAQQINAGVHIITDITARKQAEEALRKSEERLNLVIKGSNDAPWDWDLINDSMFYSHQWWKQIGYTPNEIPADSLLWERLIHHDDKVRVDNIFRGALKDRKESYEVEFRLLHKDGYYVPILSRGLISFDENKQPIRISGTNMDLTERRRTEDALSEVEKKYSTIFENAVEGIFQTTAEGRLLSANPAFAHIFGYESPQSMMDSVIDIGKHFFISDEWREEQLSLINDNTVTTGFEIQVCRKDGSACWVSINARLVKNAYGEPMYYEGFMMEITERKQSEIALRESEDRYKSIFHNNHAVMLLIDSNNAAIVDANPAACAYYGWTREELIKKRIDEINTLGAEEIESEMKLARSEKRNHFFFKHRLANGTIRDVEVYSGAILLRGKLMLYSIVHDISKRRMAEEELHRYRTHLEDMVRERTSELEIKNITLNELNTALRDAELKYRMVADNTYDWEFWINTDGEFSYISPSCQRVTGYSASEFEKDTELFQRIIHPDDHEIFENHINEEDQSHAPGFVTFRIIHRDRTEKWIEHTCQSVHDGEGKYLGRRGSNRDISERKRIAEALVESEKRLNLALHVAHMGYWDWDVRTNKVKWYGESASLFGVRDEDFGETIEHVQSYVHPDDRMRGMEIFRRVLEERILFENTYRVVHPNGDLRWLYSYGQLFYDDQDEPLNIFGVTQDITNRKQAEDEIMRRTIEIGEANTALRVLMNHRDEDRKRLEEKIESNINELVIPYLKKLSQTNNDIVRREYLKILENNLSNITTPFTNNLSNLYKNLTPQEIQIADLIRKGKNTKEIAEILGASSHTIGTHRNNIRKKVKLRNTKSNLRTFLMSLS